MTAASQVLYLGGMGRSGTTLLERVLGETPAVAPLGEVRHLWQRGIVDDDLCGCGEPFSVCPFWSAVGQRAFGGWGQVDLERLAWLRGQVDRSVRLVRTGRRRMDPAVQRRVDEYAGHYAAVYAAAHGVSGRAWLIDSSKQASLPFCLARRPEIRLRVLHCVRDPRAVAYAWTKPVRRPEAQAPDAMMPTYRPAELAAMWTVHNTGLTLLDRLGVTRSVLRYEDFADDPVGALRGVFALIGLRADTPVTGGRTVHLHRSHTCAGNPGRFREGTVQIRRDDAWRADLPRTGRLLVTALTAPLLRAYRYPVDVR